MSTLKHKISWKNQQTPVHIDMMAFFAHENHEAPGGTKFYLIQFYQESDKFEYNYTTEAELSKSSTVKEILTVQKEGDGAPNRIIESKPISWAFDTEKERDECLEWINRNYVVSGPAELPMEQLWENKDVSNSEQTA